MMRATVLFTLAASALAGDRTNSCPPNAQLTDPPYIDMRSCSCDTGFAAYTYPGWGCYVPSTVFSCPAHSTARDAQATPHTMADCQCDEGFASHENTCVYAYVFHLHGRVWLNPFTKATFGLSAEQTFRRSMASVLTHPDMAKSEVIQAADVLPYSVHETSSLATDIKNEKLDHHKIILAESDYSTEASLMSQGGVAIGFAIKLRSDSMTYGNLLVQSMKSQALAGNFLTALKADAACVAPSCDFSSAQSAHVFVWALTAEFWRSATTTSAPYTWAPKRSTEAPTHPVTNPTPPPTPLPTLAANQKAVVNMALTISCDCHLHAAQVSHLMCMLDEGYLSMYRFTGDRQASFLVAMAGILGTSAERMEIQKGGVSPAGLHPHTGETFSPVHADPFANGIEVHFRAAVTSIAESKSIMDKFNQGTQANLPTKLANALFAEGWNVPAGCIMYNTMGSGANKVAKPAQLQTFNWKKVTAAPTVAPTRAADSTPGRRPSCVSGPVIAVRGIGRVLSPAPLGDLHKENDFMWKVRTQMANKVTGGWTNADLTTSAGSGVTIKPCDILVQEGSWKRQHIRIYGAENPTDRTNDGIHADPTKALKARQDHDGDLNIYTFSFSINVPNQNMHDGNAVFDFVHGNTDFVKNVNFALGATNGREIAPKYVQGSKYRPSRPIFSQLDVSEIEYIYVTPESTFAPTPAPVAADVDCVVEWSAPTACDKKCGGGVARKFALVTVAQQGNGKACGSLVDDSMSCNVQPCPVDCKMTAWKWKCAAGTSDADCQAKSGECSLTCGGGRKTKTRTIANGWTVETGHGGLACPPAEDTGTVCNNQPCPRDCVVSQWGGWGACSKKCNPTPDAPTSADPDSTRNAGKQYRRRSIESLAYYGGAECPSLVDDVTCNVEACPTNCVMSAWSEWGSCSKNCAGKTPGTRLFGARQERERYVEVAAANGGHACPAMTQTKLCALHPCGANVCTTNNGFPLTCTYENDIVYTHHVNDVHDNELFMCYHNYVTEVCTCLCWPKSVASAVHRDAQGEDTAATSSVANFQPSV
jgi:hypothetical protein